MKVFFLIPPAARERMWATVRNQPEGIEAVLPVGAEQKGSPELYKAAISWKGKLKQWATIYLPLPNITFRTDIPEDADVIYTWSKFPLKAKKPFVIELDNPYALTYYSRRGLLLLKPLIKHWLKKAKHITFMSEACAATFRELFGNMAVPQSVSYPFMPSRIEQRTFSTSGVRFLMIALDFRLKGGPELVEAWKRAALAHASLRIITAEAEKLAAQYKDIPNLIFEAPKTNDALLKEVFPNTDIFVYPTFFDSFGVVLIEALSFGLGIIATNVYATPELVQNGRNGRLLNHPIIKPRTIGGTTLVSPIEEHFNTFIAKHMGPGAFYEDLCVQLVAALEEGAREYSNWTAQSTALFREKFAPEIWKANMKRILS